MKTHKIKVIFAKAMFDRLVGMHKYNKPVILLVKTRFGIHTFGLNYPIDVLILDICNKVVKKKQFLKPNSFFFWLPIYDTVIELPSGTINRYKIEFGDTIRIY